MSFIGIYNRSVGKVTLVERVTHNIPVKLKYFVSLLDLIFDKECQNIVNAICSYYYT